MDWLQLQHLGLSFGQKRMDLTRLRGEQMDWTLPACLPVITYQQNLATSWATISWIHSQMEGWVCLWKPLLSCQNFDLPSPKLKTHQRLEIKENQMYCFWMVFLARKWSLTPGKTLLPCRCFLAPPVEPLAICPWVLACRLLSYLACVGYILCLVLFVLQWKRNLFV